MCSSASHGAAGRARRWRGCDKVPKLTAFAPHGPGKGRAAALVSLSGLGRPGAAEVKPRTSTATVRPGAGSRTCLTMPTRGDAGAHEGLDERGSVGQGCNGMGMRGKGLPGQSTALLLRGRRCAPTSLRCSAAWPAVELAALRQWRRVSLRGALTHAATRPALLGAAQARRGLSGHAFAGAVVLRREREEPSRQAAPGGGDLWSDEDRRPGVGARSALRGLTRHSCLSAVSKANAASSATRPLAENRSAVGAQRRPRKPEPSAGTVWRDAKALQIKARPRTTTKAREHASRPQRFMRRGSRGARCAVRGGSLT